MVDSITRESAGGIEYHYTLIDFLADLGCYHLRDETLRLIRLEAKRR